MQVFSYFSVPEWVPLILAAGFLLYLHASRYRNYWKDQNVPHEKFSLFFGSTFQLIFKPFQVVEAALYKKYGRLFGSFEDGKPVLYVAEPELLKDIFVKDFALSQRVNPKFDDPYLANMMTVVPPKEWKKIRSATSPAFTTGKLRKMHDLIEQSAQHMSRKLKNAAEKELDVDMKRFYGHFTLDDTASCAFGTKLGNDAEDTSNFVISAKNAFFAKITFLVAIQVFFQRFMKTLRKNIFNMDAFEFYKEATMSIIQKRKEGKQVHDDFLQMMLNAQDEAVSTASEITESRDQEIFDVDSELQSKKSTAVKNLTEEEALAQCVLFFLAGQDTASTLASFTSYILAVNPEVQEKLRKEVDNCFEKHGGSPTYDAISKLSYLNGVISETLRMFPPAPRLERSPMVDYVLGETGIKVPKDSVIAIPVYSMHHDPEFFPDPHTFNPERFIGENTSSIRPYTYLPFGAGPRNCIGMRFALQTVKTCILHAVHNVEFIRTPRTKVPLELHPGFGLLNPKDLTVGLRLRKV
uniref:Putative cytochrome n=1 Tax=Ixodes scapularis TaxID=6945 RepID=A0A4D5RYD4_IXOSC